MITSIINLNPEPACTARIEKLVDRIQVFDTGAIDLLRYFIVHVDASSTANLRGIKFVIPVPKSRIKNPIYNFTEKLLNPDSFPYVKNAYGYNIVDLPNRIINWDGISRISVLTHSTISLEDIGNSYSTININFNQELSPGDNGAICIKYTVQDFFSKTKPNDDLEASIRYFCIPNPLPEALTFIESASREFTCQAYCSKDDTDGDEASSRERVIGGFDIVLKYPMNMQLFCNPPFTVNEGITKITSDGTRTIDLDRRYVMWKPRLMSSGYDKSTLKVKPIDIRAKIMKIRSFSEQLIWNASIAFIISVIVSLAFFILSKYL